MSAAPDRIIDQIRRVKNLMDNAGTEGEAAAAAAAYARLLQKYNLDAADIPTDDPDHLDDTIYGDERLDIQEGLANWKWKVDLAHKLALYNFCDAIISSRYDNVSPKIYTARERRMIDAQTDPDQTAYYANRLGRRRELHYMMLIGKRHNTEVVRFLYEVITRKLEELAKAYPISQPRDTSDFTYDPKALGDERSQLRHHLSDEHGVWNSKTVDATLEEVRQLHTKKHGLTAQGQLGPRKSFLYGAVTAINERLRDQYNAFKRGQSGDASKALVVINSNAVAIKAFEQQHLGKLGKHSGADLAVDGKAYSEGRAAGQAIQFQQGVGGGSSGVGTRSLGSGMKVLQGGKR